MLDLASSGGRGDEEEQEVRVKKPKGVAAIIGLQTEGLNDKKKKNTLSKADAAAGNFQKAELSRREREVLEAGAAERRHYQLTKEGKTADSKKDMARLKAMREQREAKKKKREAKEAKAAAEEMAAAAQLKSDKAAAARNGPSDDDDDDVPTKIALKKMKPAQLKELLKKKKESTQGSKSELQKRALKVCGYA